MPQVIIEELCANLTIIMISVGIDTEMTPMVTLRRRMQVQGSAKCSTIKAASIQWAVQAFLVMNHYLGASGTKLTMPLSRIRIATPIVTKLPLSYTNYSAWKKSACRNYLLLVGVGGTHILRDDTYQETAGVDLPTATHTAPLTHPRKLR